MSIFLKEKLNWIILSVVLIWTFTAFFPSLDNGFTNFDDQRHILENSDIRTFNFKSIFSNLTDKILLGYIPLTIISFSLEYHFFGLNPFVYHLDNLLLHLGIVGLIFLFALRLGLSSWAAGFAALLFGVHPMHVESVAWITERKDVLYGFFYMLALNDYWQYLKSGSKFKYSLTTLWGVLSVLAKPMALSLPLIFFLCDWFYQRKWDRKCFIDKVPHFFYIIAISWLTFSSQPSGPMSSLKEGVLTWIWTFSFYLQKFFIPLSLGPYYSLPKPIDIVSIAYLLAIVVLIAVLVFLFLFRRNKWFIFAIGFYFLSIFFLLRVNEDHFNIVADRYMYLPSLGICLLIGFLIDHRKRLLNCAYILCFILSVMTFRQCEVWQDSVALWTRVIEMNPNKDLGYVARAESYVEKKKYEEAIVDNNKALELNPYQAKTYNNRGMIHNARGRYDLAIADLSKAIELSPNFLDAFYNRGNAYGRTQQYDLALADYQKIIELNDGVVETNDAKAHFGMGMVYKNSGRIDSAINEYSEAIRIDPTFIDAYFKRGNLYLQKGQYDLALIDYKQVLKKEPNNAEVFNNQGTLYYQQGQYDLALNDFQNALRIRSDYSDVYVNRANVYFMLKDYSKCWSDLQKAESLGVKVDDHFVAKVKRFLK